MQRNSNRNYNSNNRYRHNKKKKKRITLSAIMFPMCIFLLCLFILYVSVSKLNKEDEPLIKDTDAVASSSSYVKPKTIIGYDLISMNEDDLSKGELVLINNDHKYNRDITNELVSMYDYKSNNYSVNDVNVIMRKEVAVAFNDLLNDFYRKTANNCINVTSGFRSYELQNNLYNNEIEKSGIEEAVHWVAPPGHSEHHSGYAVDINILGNDGLAVDYTGDGEYAKLNNTAPDYGFIVRYQDAKKHITGIYYEPWHFRYIGLPHSKIMQNMNLCFEEYIDLLKNYTADSEHLKFEYKNVSYEIYYCSGYDVYVPSDKEYKISGNNVDGFIVTVIN